MKFISFEPLLSGMPFDICAIENSNINWLIIGAQTPYSQKTAPKIEWVKEIVEAADNAGIPVFLKDNLKPVFNGKEYPFLVGWENNPGELRQELPEVK